MHEESEFPLYLTEKEIKDTLDNLDQCWSEGYIHYDAPASNVIEKLAILLKEINKGVLCTPKDYLLGS